jgi:hypothetical protein
MHKLILIALLFGFTFSSLSFAGTSDSGGGAAVVCRNPDQSIKSVRMLDTFESDYQNGIMMDKIVDYQCGEILDLGLRSSIPQDDVRSMTSQCFSKFTNRLQFLDHSEGKIGESFTTRRSILQLIERMQDAHEYLPTGLVFNEPSDLGDEGGIAIPNGCKIEAVGFYQNNKLKISRMLYDKLSEFDKIAFWLHEAIYQLYRIHLNGKSNKAIGTKDVRHLVSVLLNPYSNVKMLTEAFFPLTEYYSIGRNNVPTAVFMPVVIDNLLDEAQSRAVRVLYFPNDWRLHLELKRGYKPNNDNRILNGLNWTFRSYLVMESTSDFKCFLDSESELEANSRDSIAVENLDGELDQPLYFLELPKECFQTSDGIITVHANNNLYGTILVVLDQGKEKPLLANSGWDGLRVDDVLFAKDVNNSQSSFYFDTIGSFPADKIKKVRDAARSLEQYVIDPNVFND